MTTEELIAHGNTCRANNDPEKALSYYAQALAQDRHNHSAWNNYGNVLREVGEPRAAVPFLEYANLLQPQNTVSQFNLAVALLLAGDYARGWPQYEHRWNYEHLAGTLPRYQQPRWTGQDLTGRTVLIVGEQGHGDNIQFLRFARDIKQRGARVIGQFNNNIGPLAELLPWVDEIVSIKDTPENFDYWAPIMSLPGVLGTTLETLPQDLFYVKPRAKKVQWWLQTLGPKRKLRVGFCWSGRPDSWINQHKGLPFEIMLDLIARNPNYDWINLQLDATAEQTDALIKAGVVIYPGDAIHNFADSAALIQGLDVVVAVDTAVAHLSGALGRPTWIMLNWFATDWRWLLERNDSPWYPSARLFRQPSMGDWASVIERINQYLTWFKV